MRRDKGMKCRNTVPVSNLPRKPNEISKALFSGAIRLLSTGAGVKVSLAAAGPSYPLKIHGLTKRAQLIAAGLLGFPCWCRGSTSSLAAACLARRKAHRPWPAFSRAKPRRLQKGYRASAAAKSRGADGHLLPAIFNIAGVWRRCPFGLPLALERRGKEQTKNICQSDWSGTRPRSHAFFRIACHERTV